VDESQQPVPDTAPGKNDGDAPDTSRTIPHILGSAPVAPLTPEKAHYLLALRSAGRSGDEAADAMVVDHQVAHDVEKALTDWLLEPEHADVAMALVDDPSIRRFMMLIQQARTNGRI